MRPVLLAYLQAEREAGRKSGFYHQTQIKLAFNSNRIEGSKLSEEQTRYIFETNTLVLTSEEAFNVDDLLETVNYFVCFDFLLEQAEEPIFVELIKQPHFLLKQSTEAHRKRLVAIGDFKKLPNMVGGENTTRPEQVPGEMEKLLEKYTFLIKPDFDDLIEFRYRFEAIHPFQDGNGWVGHLPLFKECLKNGIIPLIINHEHRFYYYRSLKKYPGEQGYLREICRSAQDRYKALVEYFHPDLVI